MRLAAWDRQGLARYCARQAAIATAGPGEALALQLARIYDCLPLVCSRCGQAMRIVAFVTDGESVRRILAHVGEPVAPPTARNPVQFNRIKNFNNRAGDGFLLPSEGLHS